MVLMLLPLLVQAIDTQSIGAQIEFSAVVQSATTTVAASLTLAVRDYIGPGVTQRTRSYNDEFSGPTIRVKPGDTLTITLTNNLPAEAFDTAGLHNQFSDYDVTLLLL